MKFCSQCDNMFYISIKPQDKSEKLYYYCRNCQEEEEITSIKDTCVYTTQIQSNNKNYHHIINKYTKYDPTLPRIDTIPCPNTSTCTKDNPEVIYIRYDDEKQLYIYLCTECDTVWRTDNKDNQNEI